MDKLKVYLIGFFIVVIVIVVGIVWYGGWKFLF